MPVTMQWVESYSSSIVSGTPTGKAELNYSTYDKECLALIHCLKAWKPYLEGNNFILFTDHEALKWLQTQMDLNKRQARWLSILAEYDFEIQYRPGKQNVLADAMSRPPSVEQPTLPTQDNVLISSEVSSPLLKAVKSEQSSDEDC